MADRPNVTRTRTIPMPANPLPAPAPFPVAANPNEAGPERGNDLVLWGWWLAWLFHDDFFRGGRLLHDDDAARLAFDNAAREQRQAGGDDHSFD
jgi:hypothetical protein